MTEPEQQRLAAIQQRIERTVSVMAALGGSRDYEDLLFLLDLITRLTETPND